MIALLANVVAQDPAHGWMAYAVGTMPHGERITRLEMTFLSGLTHVCVTRDGPFRKIVTWLALYQSWAAMHSSPSWS